MTWASSTPTSLMLQQAPVCPQNGRRGTLSAALMRETRTFRKINDVKERAGKFRRASSALGSAPLGTLRVFPSLFEERGMREAPPRAFADPLGSAEALSSASHAVACPVPVLARLGPTKSPRASYVLTIRRS